MIAVFKYPFALKDQVRIPMPRGSKPVLVEDQGGTPTLWAVVNTDEPLVEHRFRIFGTGHPIEDAGKHVGSWQSGPFVWHLFEAEPRSVETPSAIAPDGA